jgi:hypothetical protein
MSSMCFIVASLVQRSRDTRRSVSNLAGVARYNQRAATLVATLELLLNLPQDFTREL